jgi:hypothetical protein
MDNLTTQQPSPIHFVITAPEPFDMLRVNSANDEAMPKTVQKREWLMSWA